MLTVKNDDSNVSVCVDRAVQVNTSTCFDIPTSDGVSCNVPVTSECSKVSNSSSGKSGKSSKSSNVSKPVKISSVTTTSSVTKTCTSLSSHQNNSVNATLMPQPTPSNNASQENIIPIINWNDSARNSASVHTGGVTTVLSQFPVMSTTHGSSYSNYCNKNMPTFIIPTGGSIVQHFPAEKPSNTISIICPSTLPIIVPQQILSVPSVTRNVGLQPTIICPGPVDNHSSQAEKSALSGTILAINPSSMVPISSSFATNTRIILPSQPTLLGNTCGNVNLTQNVVTPLVTAVSQSDNLIVPLVQKLPVSSPSKNIQASANTSDSSNRNCIAKDDSSSENKTVGNALKTSKDVSILTSQSQALNMATEIRTSTKKLENNLPRKAIRNPRNLSSNSPPSLQVLSANKIISLANQSQKIRTNVHLPLKRRKNETATTESLLVTNGESSESSSNCTLQTKLPKERNLSDNSHGITSECMKKKNSVTDVESSSFDSVATKSNFSLNVLIGNSLANRKQSEDCHNTDLNHKTSPALSEDTPVSDNVISSENEAVVSEEPSENVPFTDIVKSSNDQKVNDSDSSNQMNVPSSPLNSVNKLGNKGSVCNTETSVSNNPNFSNNAVSETLNNFCKSVNTSEIDNNILCNFNNLSTSNVALNVSSANLIKNMPVSKQNSSNSPNSSRENIQTVKTVNILQNGHNQSNIYSAIINSVNTTFNESVPYTANDSSINQTLLPLFSNNQIVSLNSPLLVCNASNDNTNNILLPQNIQVSNETTNQALHSCLVNDANSDFQTFSVLNKDLVLSTSATSVSILNDHPEKVTESVSNFPTTSNVNICSSNNSNKENENEKRGDSAAETDCNKQSLASKKKNKSTFKDCKTNSSAKNVSGIESPSGVSTTAALNKNQTDSSSCTRQDFIFTSDILARATESIFGNDMLESPQMPKRNEDCFSDESSNINMPMLTGEKVVDNGYKLQYNCIREEHIPESSPEKSKNIPESNTQNSDHSVNDHTRNNQESSPKQTKLCKIRKSKAVGDSEPPCKKMKEISSSPEKSSNEQNFNSSHQVNKDNEKTITSVHSNLSFLEKQVSSPQSSVEDQTGVASMGNFSNQIQLSDSACKTPSSVDAIFSLTPMLGDILKDVSHNVNLDSRNTSFLSSNENQGVFLAEKNFISLNYPNNSNEEYLNLPRMYFPIIPEISSAPIVQVTNVSFAHSISLCSTQSDSQKTTETHASTDSQSKSNSKKKDILPLFHNTHNGLNLDLAPASNIPKQSECVLKVSDSEPQYSVTSAKGTNTSSVLFDVQHSDSQNLNSIHSKNLAVSQYGSRDNFMPPVSHTLTFYPTISSSSNIQNFPCTTSSVPHVNYHNSSSVGSLSFQPSGNTSNSFSSQSTLSKPDNLSHSLCSLLKESNNNMVMENRGGTSEASSQNTPSTSSNVAQSKYSALSLISDQTPYSESVQVTTCHPHFVQSTAVYTTSGSEGQYISTVSSCSRNPKTSLSYSAESLLQTCANTEKNKNKNNNRYSVRTAEKKIDRTSVANMHSVSDTNIFMPVTSCDINIQNAPLVPLPPVTSFHNFSSSYTICDTVPSTTIFNSVTRNQDIPLSLSNDNFLNHMNLNVESQMLSNRHEVSPTVPKPHSNITLSFENHNTLYNNCNFLPHVKSTLEGSRSSEAPVCFQPSSYSNNYTQQTQKPNCCHFSHRAVATNSDISTDINLPVAVSGTSFHGDKNSFQANRTGLQTTFSQSNSNFMGNFFYNTPTSCRDGNDINIKPSTIRTSQETFVPDGVRQSIHEQTTGVTFNSRKTVPSNRTKSKKPKNNISNENINVIPTCMTNYSSSQDNSCNKANISYVPNGYFKSSSHPVLPPPGQLQCSQNKIAEAVPPAVIPANPSFNPVLHQQGDNFLNLNFQHPNFTMSPLPRPPTQPLSCSCLTTPIISHTFSSTTPHPVPNFNLSNILPDMGCSGNQVSFSPAKFPMNHALSSTSTQCQANPTISNSAHIVSHQSCAPSLYPPHPPMVRSSLNPILGHNSQTLIDSQVSLAGTAGAVMSPNTTFTATQNPTFRNVIHSITFPRNDR